MIKTTQRSGNPLRRTWRRHFWRRKEVVRTTWLFRGVVGLVLLALFLATHTWLLTAVGKSLVHDGPVSASDAIVLENYNPDYLVFEMARNVRREGLAGRIIVPCDTFGGPTNLNDVAEGFIGVMANVSHIGDLEVIPILAEEPITLNTVRAVSEYLVAEGIRSVIVVSPLFRSRRSYLVYRSVLDPLGIEVCCVPSRSTRQPDNWWQTTHGIQNVVQEFGKLWYYRLVVL